MRTTIAVHVDAPARLVFDLVSDIRRWPDLLPHYLRVRVREHHGDGAVTAEMVAVRPLLPTLAFGPPVMWRARFRALPDELQLHFVHRGGPTGGMEVTWRIDPTPGGCRVSIEHDFRPAVPAWAAVIDRLFVRPIARRTLGTFKSIAEAVAGLAEPHHRSGMPPPTNPLA